jgi:hypothetical protein
VLINPNQEHSSTDISRTENGARITAFRPPSFLRRYRRLQSSNDYRYQIKYKYTSRKIIMKGKLELQPNKCKIKSLPFKNGLKLRFSSYRKENILKK